ncbi:DUF6538 domain-containing protein [Phaeobacter piscinae]|uniref:DUF6538 domain-containing protein n=1 Tax=Phaeobacter piscinae TaxID=1580596 RepID=UPI0039F651E1
MSAFAYGKAKRRAFWRTYPLSTSPSKRVSFYFNRRVPKDLRSHYSCSLRTRSRAVALVRASGASVKLDVYWYHLRS